MKTSDDGSSAPGDHLAAIDLGSNSFHMVIARRSASGLEVVAREQETVRLADRLEGTGIIDPAAAARGISCLEGFRRRLLEIEGPVRLRVVGTHALRQAGNAADFCHQAERILGAPVAVISGTEEARLIYRGVVHVSGASPRRRLVIDIGGGSTELVLGEGLVPGDQVSLAMGCVSMSQRHFREGALSRSGYTEAVAAASAVLASAAARFRGSGFRSCLGSSGTLVAVETLLSRRGARPGRISREGLDRIEYWLLAAEHVSALDLAGVSPDRALVLPGGLAILRAVFDGFALRELEVSTGALREGVLVDLAAPHAP